MKPAPAKPSRGSRMSLQLPLPISPAPSLPPSPGPSVLLPAASIDSRPHAHTQPFSPRRLLLMPTVRRLRFASPVTPAAPPRPRHHGSPRIRAKAASVPAIVLEPESSAWDAAQWFHSPRRFEIVREQASLSGFQLYAVEKWVTERSRPVIVLVVYTGDPSHKITVTALSPSTSLTPREAEEEWQKGLYDLRRDGARPRETDQGTLMVTSLANFRSDYTIVHIPSGNYLEAREELYVNINLLRMGCSGRGALTLQEPSDTIKDRFIQTYRFTDKTLVPDVFTDSVLELVRLIQAGLGLFGMFDLSPEENGLLCDVTVEAVQRWIDEIGEPICKLESTERIAGPAMVAALFSVIIATRNKLQSVGHNHLVPKDPFTEPQALLSAAHAFQSQSKTPPMDAASSVTYLSPAFLDALDAAFEKGRQNEAYKVHRVLLNKLDDLATDLRDRAPEAAADSAFASDTRDLAVFVKTVLGSGKDAAPSLASLWAGQPRWPGARRREREREPLASDSEQPLDERAAAAALDAKSTDDEGDVLNAMPWSNRMQKRIGNWANLHRKKHSVDFPSKSRHNGSPVSDHPASELPTVVVTDDDPFNTGGWPARAPRMSAQSSLQDDDSADNFSHRDRLVNEFMRQRPAAGHQSRISSWSDPFSARDMLDGGDSRSRKQLKPSRLGHSSMIMDEDIISSAYPSTTGTPEDELEGPSWRMFQEDRRRRHSFSVGNDYSDVRVLPVDRMRIDVDLCGQLLIMRRREPHLENVVECLEMFTAALASTNRNLHAQHQEFQRQFAPLEPRAAVYAAIERQRADAETATQDANALAYESAQFRAADLWQLASHSRLKVFGMRAKVFGTGRRVRHGVRGAHGRYTHLQWTLNGEGRLVDQLGRTESEAEEEEGLPRVGPRLVEEEEEPEFVSNPSMKPTWLLRFFNTWRARWRAGAGEPAEDAATSDDVQSPVEDPATIEETAAESSWEET